MSDVEIKLEGKSETLRCTLKAAKRVNAAGGFAHVLNRLQTADLEFYILVVAAGLDKKTSEVEEKVFRTGLPSLGADLAKYTNLLATGGKPFNQKKLKVSEIDGKSYADLDSFGNLVYLDEDETTGSETSGEG